MGRKGGLTLRASRASQSMSLKKACVLMAVSPPWAATQPSRLAGFFVINWTKKTHTKKTVTPRGDVAEKKNTADPFEDGDGLLGEPHRVEDVVVQDRLEEVVLVVGLERRLAGHHFVHQHPQRPPAIDHNRRSLESTEGTENKGGVADQSTVAP